MRKVDNFKLVWMSCVLAAIALGIALLFGVSFFEGCGFLALACVAGRDASD
jgi:hypothetical protein